MSGADPFPSSLPPRDDSPNLIFILHGCLRSVDTSSNASVFPPHTTKYEITFLLFAFYSGDVCLFSTNVWLNAICDCQRRSVSRRQFALRVIDKLSRERETYTLLSPRPAPLHRL